MLVNVSKAMYTCTSGAYIDNSFTTGATAHTDAYFGEGSGPIHLDFVQCSGSEYNLTECEIRNNRVQTSHVFDVGVKCQPGRVYGVDCLSESRMQSCRHVHTGVLG